MLLLLHPPAGLDLADLAPRWTFDPLLFLVLACSTFLYARGVSRIWKRAGMFRGVRVWQVNCFGSSLIVLLLSLVSPLDALSDVLFAAHMTQHELLMVVAAPLMAAGKPLLAMLWGLPAGARERLTAALSTPWITRVLRALTGPLFVLAIQALVLWLWHIPALFEAALRSELVHAVQHVSMFVSAALFWWVVVHGRYGRTGYGVSLLFVFATAAHTSILGALMLVARRVWYVSQSRSASRFGLDALDDQALAGLIMWVPCGIVLVAIALALFAAWIGESARRVRELERSGFRHH